MNFSIDQVAEIPIDLFGLNEYYYEISFSNVNLTFEEAISLVEDMVANLVDALRSKMKTSDKIALTFDHSQFFLPISIPFMRKKNFTNSLVLEYLMHVTQSYKDLLINPRNSLNAIAQIQKITVGSGRRSIPESEKKKYVKKIKVLKQEQKQNIKKIEKPKTRIKILKKKQRLYVKQADRLNDLSNLQQKISKKRSILKIRPELNDNYCALRSILIGKSYIDFKHKLITQRPSTVQLNVDVKRIALKLKLEDKPLGIAEIKQIERYLKYYSICVLDGKQGNLDKKFLYQGPFNKYYIYILFTESHFNVIRSMKAFQGTVYFCDYCKKGYNTLVQHACIKTCKSCKKQSCLKTLRTGQSNSSYKCTNCKQISRNKECMQFHIEHICTKKKICHICDSVYFKKFHVCLNQKFCSNCKTVVESSHKCFLSSDKFPHKAKRNLIFFDYECYQLNGKHIPNLIVAKFVCIKCLDMVDNNDCKCESVSFDNNNKFCEWIFQKEQSTAIAHNFRAYDGLFIMEYILSIITCYDKMPKILLKGAKLLSLEFRGLKFIDSLNFLPMPLASFAKTFDLKELKKGFWCYDFNTKENQNYIGPIPDQKYYGTKFMSKDKYADFLKFYNDNKDKTFDFKQECLNYCKSDVDLLMNGCLSFRKNIKEVTKNEKFPEGIDPFLCSITIASLANFIFRNIMLKPKTMGIINETGYNPKTHSKKAIQWLDYIAFTKNIHIIHARNGKEVKFGPFSVDGFHEESNTVYEYFGCWFHACDICFKQTTFNKTMQMTMSSVRRLHNIRMEKLRNMTHKGQPIKIISVWEHTFDKEIQNNEKVRQFFSTYQLVEPLNPRDSFYGGRTECFCRYFKAASHQKIRYIDFTSVYPYIQKNLPLPVGHPEIITKDFKSLDEYFGLIKIKVLAPRKLFVPVLPIRSEGRLLFTLCKKCGDNRQYNCKHNDDQRSFIGTWVTEEVREAVKQGYKILKVFEVWHFKERTTGLFKDYVNTFLKGKQESSGFPKGVETEGQKAKYINEFKEIEGILLDINKIIKNPGMRAICKLLLNSLWGKLAELLNKLKFKVIADPNEWFELIANDQYIVERVDYSNNKYLQVHYKNQSAINEESTKTNIAIASFITAYGRLKLYEYLNKLGARILYCDTDCIIFWTEEGLYEPKLGDNLGDFTDEINGEKGDFIVEFVGVGEKFYSYRTNNGYTHALCKGIAFNRLTSIKLNFESFKEMAIDDPFKEINVEQLNFIRNKTDWSIKTETFSKTVKNTYNKRQILSNLIDTVPYGF
jgi:hypothetical protein